MEALSMVGCKEEKEMSHTSQSGKLSQNCILMEDGQPTERHGTGDSLSMVTGMATTELYLDGGVGDLWNGVV
jgi:hypothetical protein